VASGDAFRLNLTGKGLFDLGHDRRRIFGFAAGEDDNATAIEAALHAVTHALGRGLPE
jgi:hypothetical protein